MWEFLKRGKPDEKILASQALSYLVEAQDVVPDSLGLFGLVDDLEAIRIAIERLNPTKRSQHILQEVLAVDASILFDAA